MFWSLWLKNLKIFRFLLRMQSQFAKLSRQQLIENMDKILIESDSQIVIDSIVFTEMTNHVIDINLAKNLIIFSLVIVIGP